jgi:hypothetical protein
MKKAIVALAFGVVALTAASTANAQIRVNVGINPCGYPVIYQTCPYYAPPAAVYLGGGSWGGDRGRRGGGRAGGTGHAGGGRGGRH